jgi:hypothetical protein
LAPHDEDTEVVSSGGISLGKLDALRGIRTMRSRQQEMDHSLLPSCEQEMDHLTP